MKSLNRIGAMAAMTVVACLSSAQTVAAQALPTAPEVIAKYVAAIGGKDAIMKIKSIASTGTLEVPAMGLTATMEVFQAAPNRMATKTTIPGMGDLTNGFNGTVAWDVNPMAGPRLLADKELEQMKDNAGFYDNMLFSAERFTKMEVQSVADFAGEKAYKVVMVRKGSGTESTQYFSVASGLLIGGESTNVSQMGAMQVQQTISEYKAFGGIKMPTRMEQTAGPNKMILTTTAVKFNEVPESAFDIPAQVKPLIKP